MKDIFQQAVALIEQNDWDAAHNLVQDEPGVFGALLHGYLHRIEGDMGNASYWYRRANQPMLANRPEEELTRIKQLLAER